MTTDRPGHPHENSAVARFLDKRFSEMRGVKSQREIAAEAGYPRPNILSMLKSGESALSLARIPALAKAIEVDPAHLLRVAMIDQLPDLAAVVDEIFGRQMSSANEAALFLYPWRALTSDADPTPNQAMIAAANNMLKELQRML